MSSYLSLLSQAQRHIIHTIMADVECNGLRENSYFYITVNTQYPRLVIPDFVRAKYPSEISIVLQHQFSNLVVSADKFDVDLSFGGVLTTLSIPFEAIIVFADPAHDFAVSFKPNTVSSDIPKSAPSKADIIRLSPKNPI